ncbi:MAG: PilN domain-containing protein [Salinisphaeraceae bacterium]|nr:PilN domain-containing protein [Salinisphaeraceae bacterium]
MIKINLLDWRNERRERRKKQFLTALGMAAVATVAAVLLGLFYMNSEIEHQNQRNAFLKLEIKKIEKQIKEIENLERLRADLIARMQVIERLQRNRAESVHYIDEIVNTLPEGVYLTSLAQSGKQTKLTGIAESNGRISTYMKNFDANDRFSNPRLVIIRAKSADYRRLSDFTMTVQSVTPKKQDADAVEAE